MEQNFANSAVTAEDLAHVLMRLTTEIVALARPNDADQALDEIANHLLDSGRNLPHDNRSGQLLKALAYHLMGTEHSV
jgi:hypothetical protein